MTDSDKDREQLIQELAEMRRRVSLLEGSEVKRREAEEALRRERLRLRLFYDNNPDAIVVMDMDQRILYANRRTQELTGIPLESLQGARCFEAVMGISSVCDGCAVQEVIETKKSKFRIKHEITSSGKENWLQQLWYPICDREGKVESVVEIARDITELKRTEERSKLKAQLLDAATDSIFLHDFDGNFFYFNEAAHRSRGYDREELMNMNLRDLDIPEYAKLIAPRMEGLLQKGETTFEAAHFRKDKSVMPVEVHARIIESGGRTYILSVTRDITERLKMEEELIKARKLESIGILASGIAHDFNNLLTGILNCLSLAKVSVGRADSVFETLTVAEDASRQARNLIGELFTFAKIGEPVRKRTSIAQLVRDSVLVSLGSSNVECEFSLADDLWPAEVDEGQLRRVIYNLVINAVEAMPDGGTIKVHAQNGTVLEKGGLPLKEGGRYIELSVQDQGKGIPEHLLHKIFDPYFTTKQKGSQKGTGLGLAICYSIVKNHDGLIAVTSEVGAGTTFHIYLPASPEEDPPDRD